MESFAGSAPHRPLLQSDPSEIRLVKLHPGTFDSPIRCELLHASLTSGNPAFIALSYTWGDPTVTLPIEPDGQQAYPVTTNLESFLRHMQCVLFTVLEAWQDIVGPSIPTQPELQCLLKSFPDGYQESWGNDEKHVVRDAVKDTVCYWRPSLFANLDQSALAEPIDLPASRKPRGHDDEDDVDRPAPGIHLWIDAICINQQDIAERNVQVLRMAEIFGSASSTIIRLGHHGQLSELETTYSFDLLRTAGRRMYKDGKPAPAEHDEAWQLIEDFSGVFGLFALPWFCRMWIIQELVLSKGNVTMWCGYYRLDWEIIMAGCFWYMFAAVGAQLHHSLSHVALRITKPAFDLWNLQKQNARQNRRLRPRAPVVAGTGEGHTVALPTTSTTANTTATTATAGSDGDIAVQLMSLLEVTYGKFQASDPRDQIYALYGLLFDAGNIPPPIRPDYSLPISTVFHQLATYLLRHSNSISLVLSANEGVPNAPTWVPNFASFEGMLFSDDDDDDFNTHWWRVSENTSVLEMHGFVMERIEVVVRQSVDASLHHLADWAENTITSLTPRLGAALLGLEEAACRYAREIEPSLPVEDFMARWQDFWDLNEEGRQEIYDVLVGRTNPNEFHTTRTLLKDSSFLSTAESILETAMEGLAIVRGGHLLRSNRLVEEGYLVCALRGMRNQCVLESVGEPRYRFRGLITMSSLGGPIDEKVFEENKDKIGKFILV